MQEPKTRHPVWKGIGKAWRVFAWLIRQGWRGLAAVVAGCLWGWGAYKKASPWMRCLMLVLMFGVGLLVLLPLDSVIFNAMPEKVENPPPDIWMLLRKLGHLLLWLAVGVAWILVDWNMLSIRRATWTGWSLRGVFSWLWSTVYRVRHTRGAVLFLCALLSCATSEVLKILIRRERAHWEGFETLSFRPWWEGGASIWESVGQLFTSAGLTTPSSHTAVAFGAAFALVRFFPAASPVWLLMALGAGISRIVHRAHVPTDVYISIFVSYVIVWAVFAWLKPESHLPPRKPRLDLPAHSSGSGI